MCVRRDARRRPPLGSQLGRQGVEPLRADAQVEEAKPAGGSHLCLVRVRVRVSVRVRGRGRARARGGSVGVRGRGRARIRVRG